MNNFEKKQELSKIGFDIYPGCRCSIVEQATIDFGIDINEIIAKMKYDDIIDAIHKCCEISGLYAENDNDDHTCNRCDEIEGECLCEEND
jgi:hypothetical protein